MKRYVITSIAAATVLSLGSASALAQTKVLSPTVRATTTTTTTPAASPTDAAASASGGLIEKEVQNLKDKIADKVAELRKKDRKAVSGMITAIKDNTITIKTSDEAEYEVKRDETLTKIYQVTSTKKEIKFADLEKGDYIIATGPILDKSVDANTIYRDVQYVVKSGKITEVNKDDYYIKVITSAKDTYTLDIENKTTQYLMDIKTLDQTKVGFSKLKEGDVVHFTAKNDGTQKEANRFSAERILIVPQEYFQK